MADFEEFRDIIKKVNHKRTIKVTNSYGVADGYKYYKKIKPKDSKFNITNSDYRYIIRRVNTELGELFIKGEDIIFPYRLGRLELRKIESKIKFDGNKEINRNDYNLATIDHKISVLAGYLRGISPEIISDVNNLC